MGNHRKEKIQCIRCGVEKPRPDFSIPPGMGASTCRDCLAQTEWNTDPDWPGFLEQFRGAIEDVAAARVVDPMLRDDAIQAAWIRLYRLRPEDSRHFDAYQRGEIDRATFYDRILRYLVNAVISRAIYSAVYHRTTRRYGALDPIHEPWPTSSANDPERDGGSAHQDYADFPADGPDPSELAEQRIDYRRMVTSRAIPRVQREALVMWSVGYTDAETGRILGQKYQGKPYTDSTIRYHKKRALKVLRERYAHAA